MSSIAVIVRPPASKENDVIGCPSNSTNIEWWDYAFDGMATLGGDRVDPKGLTFPDGTKYEDLETR